MGTNTKRETARAIPRATPQEATMPKVWKNETKMMGKGSLSREKTVFLDKTKLALRLAIKMKSTKFDSVHERAKMTKAEAKITFCWTKAKAGDQKAKPARKIPANTKVIRPLRVKQVFMNSWSLST